MSQADHYAYKTHGAPVLAALRSLSLSRSPRSGHQRPLGDSDVQPHPHFLCSLFPHHFLLTLGLFLPLTPSHALDSGGPALMIKDLISQVCVRAAGRVTGRRQSPALWSSVLGAGGCGGPRPACGPALRDPWARRGPAVLLLLPYFPSRSPPPNHQPPHPVTALLVLPSSQDVGPG